MTANAVEISFLNAAGAMDPATFAFACAAAQVQLQRDFLPAWSSFLPVKREYVTVGYTRATDLAPGSFAPIQILPSLGDPAILGDHSGFEATGTAYGRSLALTVPMTHEALELAADPYANRWVRLPTGLTVSIEVSDPVENDSYPITVTVGGQTRDVMVSNFVYPAWFGEGGGTTFDHMGLCTAAGENRGYIIVADDQGNVSNVFAATATPAYFARVQAKLQRPGSRTALRHVNVTQLVGPLRA